MVLTMLKSEGFENVWVELKGGVGTRHESENSNNREDIDVVSRYAGSNNAGGSKKKRICELEFLA